MRKHQTTSAHGGRIQVMGLHYFVFVIFVSFNSLSCQDVALNTPQVLLPYVVKGSVPTNYVLRATKGCFKW